LLVQRERHQLLATLPHLFGVRLIQVGEWDFDRDLLDHSAALCQWVLGPRGCRDADVVFDGESLPLLSKSVDAVILPHSLEVSASPRRLLREADRVLCDHGHLVILGFNPFNPWTFRQRLMSRRIGTGRLRFYALGHVGDWLDLLDFEVVKRVRYGVGFPYLPADGVDVANGGWWRLPSVLGQAYLIVARKRVVPLTLQRAPMRRRVPVVSGMPEPAPRGGCAAREPLGRHAA